MMTPVCLIALALGQVSADDAELAKICRVQVVPAKSGDRVRQVAHLSDYHFVTKDAWESDLRDQDESITQAELDESYDEFLRELPQPVAAAQGPRLPQPPAVHLEGLTDEDQKVFELIIRVVRRQKIRDGDTWLRIGAAGQLYVDGKLKQLLPAEDTEKYRAANPVDGEQVEFDAKAEAARLAAMVKRLEQHKQALVVLGMAHDLSGLVDKDMELVVLITVPTLASDDGATEE